MKSILLFRHFESFKNVDNKFSSESNQEELTQESLNTIKDYSAIFDEIISQKKVTTIYCADSKRAIDSAGLLVNKNVKIETLPDFNSIKYNSKGLPEKEVENSNPAFMNGLSLYRKGLFSSYLIPTPADSESVIEFEKRVWDRFNSIIKKNNSDLVIFFLHRSPITSILINFARKYYNYPKDFFGYVELDLGYFSLLRLSENHGEIKIINENIDKLENLFRTGNL